MKTLLFVSSGRCGTVRLTQILQEKLPADQYAVVHQMRFSRIANVVGNILYHFKGFEHFKAMLYAAIVANYRREKHFVAADPLTAMVIPQSLLKRPDTHIVHVQRDHDEFARSMISLTRKRLKSRIAHNLVPFWQPGILPLENQLRHRIHSRYKRVSEKKNRFFACRYGKLKNYWHVDMYDLFNSDRLASIIEATLGETIEITRSDLSRKANAS